MPCKTVGIGTIRIKMYDGIVRTLTDVWYVPESKKNLISLGVLDSNGCRCTIEGGVMKVSKGALVVIRGQQNDNLYILQGSMVSGTTVVSLLTNSNSNITHL